MVVDCNLLLLALYYSFVAKSLFFPYLSGYLCPDECPAQVEAHDAHPAEHADAEVEAGVAQEGAGDGAHVQHQGVPRGVTVIWVAAGNYGKKG